MNKKVKIILTGGEGLIGSAFRCFLNKKSEGVQLVDTEQKKHNKRYPLESIINLKSSTNSVDQELKGGTFIHAAGMANVSLCDKQPKLAEEANIDLTLSCLQKALSLGCQKFVFLSTGFIYGDKTTTPHEESAPTSITNVYLDTKFRAEKLIEDFATNNNIKGIILRLGNVYSKSSSLETAIGRILSQLNGGSKTIELFSIKPVRDFIYIEDLCEAIYQVIKSSPKKNCQIFNLSYGEGVSIANIIDVLVRIEGPLNLKQTQSDMKDSTLILNTNKFKTTFQWNPRINIITGLSRIQSK